MKRKTYISSRIHLYALSIDLTEKMATSKLPSRLYFMLEKLTIDVSYVLYVMIRLHCS
jgi:hypothetical protein